MTLRRDIGDLGSWVHPPWLAHDKILGPCQFLVNSLIKPSNITHKNKSTQIESSGPGRFLRSCVVNQVLAARLVQRLKGLRHPRNTEQMNHATKDRLRRHSLLFLLFALCVTPLSLSHSLYSVTCINASFFLLLSFRSFQIDTFDPKRIDQALRFLVFREIGISDYSSLRMHASPQTL